LIATPRADRAAAAPPRVVEAAAPFANLERIETTLTPASPTEPPLTSAGTRLAMSHFSEDSPCRRRKQI
jgi:hypothetical protein